MAEVFCHHSVVIREICSTCRYIFDASWKEVSSKFFYSTMFIFSPPLLSLVLFPLVILCQLSVSSYVFPISFLSSFSSSLIFLLPAVSFFFLLQHAFLSYYSDSNTGKAFLFFINHTSKCHFWICTNVKNSRVAPYISQQIVSWQDEYEIVNEIPKLCDIFRILFSVIQVSEF